MTPPPRFLAKMKTLALCILLSFAAFAQNVPKLTVSATKVQHHGFVTVHGSGFTSQKNISSHLRRPDGSEFPVLPILTDERGQFSHEIDTLLLAPGTHEVWVIDDTSKATSNIVRFEVTEAPPK